MASGQAADGSSSSMALRKVLELGENLQAIAQGISTGELEASAILAVQCNLLTQTVSHLVNGISALWLSEDELNAYIGGLHARALAEPGNSLCFQPTPLIQACILNRRPVAAQSVSSELTWDIHKNTYGLETNAVAAPLLVHNRNDQTSRLLGVLQLERAEGHHFSHPEIELIEGLALQSALALGSTLSAARERWQREQFGLVGQVSLQIAAFHEVDKIARSVTDLVRKAFNFYYVAIFTLDKEKETLSFQANSGPGLPLPGSEPVYASVRLGEGIVGTVAQTGEELVASDVQSEPHYRHFELLPETRSEVALPLLTQNRLVGVLDVQSKELDYFKKTDLLILRALAGNIAVAIDNAQLYQELQHRAVQLQTVYEVNRAIASILNQEQLLEEVVSLIQERFGIPKVRIFSVHPGRRRVFFEAGSGFHSQIISKESHFFDLDDPHGLIPWAARHGETILVNDVRQEPRYRSSEAENGETLSELTVPLIFGGDVLGVLDVQSDRLNAFNEENCFLIEALADHVAIALRNAQLYRTEVWRRKVADGLREVAGILSADIDLNQVLEAILKELEHTLPLEAAAIWLLDEKITEKEADLSRLHLAAVRAESTTDLDLSTGLQPDELVEYNLNTNDPQVLQRASAWLIEALNADGPIIRTTRSPFEPLGSVLGFAMDYSAIAVPLKIGNQTLGVLSLIHGSSRRYGNEAQAITAAFGSYAAVAIENARLYEDAHEQAWIATALLQVANATQSIDNLSELLNTVVRITPMLTGVKACMLYIRDEDGTFVPAAATGLSREQQSEFERWQFEPGDTEAFDRLVEERGPVILHQGKKDQRLLSILSAGAVDEIEAEVSFPVLIPLQARGEVLGTFLVDYSMTLSTLSLGKSFEAFFDERLAILQGIAHQTAMAVDNIRLLKAQKDEAYLSVALLQIAQAVGNSKDLDEALGAIVRSTPILVGVKRAVIYLWDEMQEAFRLSQAYGLPRAAESEVYKADGFPLLDAVFLRNQIFAVELMEDRDDKAVPGYWAGLRVPEQDQLNLYLQESTRLLIAFPLSVKGKALGVFLVEEPLSSPGETLGGGNDNRSLRPRRMEIITGISQQASMAIQNEALQKEALEQERLEREMQLAREIQVAFLPQEAPHISGWDLQAYWHPAREVGGDFYDFFELPGNRLGLLIADVADKGMPAALFMTLVRTLVRATVQALDSPAEVVERVNDLLVPDAMGGMFVTLAYVILDLNSGELVIANAGHNPPLIFHLANRFVRTESGGMALGVETGARIQEFRYYLEPGGFLILYTDGVTESFSPDGEIFGENRLIEAIQEAAGCPDMALKMGGLTAQSVLEAIARKVVEFCGENPIYDDLTLIVVHRSI